MTDKDDKKKPIKVIKVNGDLFSTKEELFDHLKGILENLENGKDIPSSNLNPEYDALDQMFSVSGMSKAIMRKSPPPSNMLVIDVTKICDHPEHCELDSHDGIGMSELPDLTSKDLEKEINEIVDKEMAKDLHVTQIRVIAKKVSVIVDKKIYPECTAIYWSNGLNKHKTSNYMTLKDDGSVLVLNGDNPDVVDTMQETANNALNMFWSALAQRRLLEK